MLSQVGLTTTIQDKKVIGQSHSLTSLYKYITYFMNTDIYSQTDVVKKGFIATHVIILGGLGRLGSHAYRPPRCWYVGKEFVNVRSTI